jgi:hypothetical protein
MAGIFLYAVSTVFAYSGGSGTTDDPYQIGTVSDWNDLMNTPSDWDANFIMTADVNLQGVPLIPVGNNINNIPNFFNGVFDGNGHVIRNAEINMPGYWHIGLFGIITSDSQVRNLGVEDVNMSGHRDVAGLAGLSKGTISNCFATGNINYAPMGQNGANLGGLVGLNWGTIINSHALCDVNGSAIKIGGLVGYNYGSVTDSYAIGSINGNNSVGGLIGENTYAPDESGSGFDPDYIGTIKRCYAAGAVSGNSNVGGLVGINGNDPIGYIAGLYITDCYSISTVTGGSGLVWRNYGHIINCYAAGKVNGSGGGLGGSLVPPLINCFWDIEATGQTTSASGTGLTTAEMKTLSPFISAGWDFVDTWGISENQTYPFLRTYSGADLNYDGLVNLIDFAVVADHWLEGL